MHHVKPDVQQKVIQLAARHVVPGGILIYKDLVTHPIWRALANRMHDLVVVQELIHYTALSKIKLWASQCGFEEIKTDNCNKLRYGHE